MGLIIAAPSFVGFVCLFKVQGVDFERFDMSITESDVQSSTVTRSGKLKIISRRKRRSSSGNYVTPFSQTRFIEGS